MTRRRAHPTYDQRKKGRSNACHTDEPSDRTKDVSTKGRTDGPPDRSTDQNRPSERINYVSDKRDRPTDKHSNERTERLHEIDIPTERRLRPDDQWTDRLVDRTMGLLNDRSAGGTDGPTTRKGSTMNPGEIPLCSVAVTRASIARARMDALAAASILASVGTRSMVRSSRRAPPPPPQCGGAR